MARLTILEAVRRAVRDEMRRDQTVWAMGEDLLQGGIFGQYAGLAEEFGAERVVSTPISEATIMGAGLGAALAGTRPIVEMRIADFALCAIDELVNQIAKCRYMFGGQAKVPAVIRMPHGAWRNSAAQHSQSLESWFVHVPGLVVVAPATPADAHGLLKAAIRCDDPVVFLEPRAFWGQEGEVDESAPPPPIGRARIARDGTDVTLVAWSSIVNAALEAADIAGRGGISVEVIDLRSLWPWDEEAVVASARRTGRVAIAQEAVTVCGFGAEVAATLAGRADLRLRAPIRRVGAPRVPVPFSPPLEDAQRVTAARIAAAVTEVVRQ
jgi:pyruvate dehydrogenase E1 component beta subunit